MAIPKDDSGKIVATEEEFEKGAISKDVIVGEGESS